MKLNLVILSNVFQRTKVGIPMPGDSDISRLAGERRPFDVTYTQS